MADDPAPPPRSAHRGLSLSNRATVDVPVMDDPRSRHRAGGRRGLGLGDWADVTPLVVEGTQPHNAADRRPRSPRPDAIQLIVGVGVAAVVGAQAVLQAINVPADRSGAVLVLLQASSPVFVALLTVFLLHACRQLRGSAAARFWINCVAAAALAYVVWSGIYFVADGGWRQPLPAASRTFARDVLTGSPRAQLALVFVAVQLCVVLPLVRWLIRVTRGLHRRLLLVGFGLQLAVSATFYWALPASDPDRLLPSYLLFVAAGALVVEHQDELRDWSRHLGLAVACVVAGVLAAEVSYGVTSALHATPGRATQAVQPAVTMAGVAALIALFAAGAHWEGRRHPPWQLQLLSRWSDAATGVYLTSPLLVQVSLGLLSVIGLGAGSAHSSGTTRLALGLVIGVPLLLVASGLLATGLRRSALSLALTGRRQLAPARVAPRGQMALNATAGVAGLAILLGVALPLAPRTSRLASQAMTAGGLAQSTTRVAPVATATDTTVHKVTVGGFRRTYEVIQPQHPVSRKLPVLVFLHGIDTGLSTEENRDGLLPLATAGQAILVYPAGFDESWNDGVCCSLANRHGVDDVAFLTDVVHASAKLHHADSKLVDVVGYSDGGKMAYRLVCQHPRLVAGAVVIAAVQAGACPSGPPVPLLQVTGDNDPLNPYQHVVKQVNRWVRRDGCGASTSADVYDSLTLQRWSTCDHGSRVEFATYAGAGHSPFGGDGTPTMARVVVSFVERTPFTG